MTTASKEAPGGLAMVREFVNTLEIDQGTDALADPSALAAWLEQHELLTVPAAAVGPADLERAVAVREALRELLLSNNDGQPAGPAAPAVLNDVAARAGLRLRVGADGLARLEVEGEGADGALGRLLVAVYRAMVSGAWRRLKVCRNDTCRWAFFDQSKNQSRHWCSMEVCGSRHKAHEYRERHKSVGAS